MLNFDEIQKAMEDVTREAFDYFLDRRTGELIILSQDIISRAQELLCAEMEGDEYDYDEVVFDEEKEIPDWMEDEVELVLDIFLHDPAHYARIPERSSADAFTAMQQFVETLQEGELKQSLTDALNGKGVFRKFKDLLDAHPKEKKLWYTFNAKAARHEIEQWLDSLGTVTGAAGEAGQ